MSARLAAQARFERLFKTFLADLESRCDEEGVLFLLIFLGRCRADITNQMANGWAVGVEAREAAHRVDAWKLGKPHRHCGIFVERDILGHFDRAIALRLLQLADHAVHIVDAQVEQLLQGAERRLRGLQLVRDDVDAEIASIDGDGLVVPVDDPSPTRRYDDQLDAIALGQELVMLVLGNGEPAKPAEDQCSDCSLRPRGNGHAPREGHRLMNRREAPFHLHRPSLQRSTRETNQATTGKERIEINNGGRTVRKGSDASMTWATRHSAASFASSISAARIHSSQ